MQHPIILSCSTDRAVIQAAGEISAELSVYFYLSVLEFTYCVSFERTLLQLQGLTRADITLPQEYVT